MASTLLPTEVPQTIGDRLQAQAVAHRDAEEIAHRCAAAWRACCVEAIEAGMTQLHVAELAGVSRARIHAILVAEYSRP